MRKLLMASGSLLTAGSVGVFYLCRNGTADRLCFEWDAPWLIEQGLVIKLACLSSLVVGLWCFCLAVLTYPQVRAKAAPLPVAFALLVLIAALWFGAVLRVGHAISLGEVRIHPLHDADGVRCTVITTSSLSPKVCLWVGPGVPDPSHPDFRVLSECWAPHEIRPSETAGRYLVLGRDSNAGALIDLGVPTLIGYRELTDLDALRLEFGADVNLVERNR